MRTDAPEVKVEQLSAEVAEALRGVCTRLGLAEHCPFRPCQRTKRCSTRHVICWQYLKEEINPLIQRALAYDWEARVAAGEVMDIAPVKEHDFKHLLERERENDPAEAARVAASAAAHVAAEIAAREKAVRKAAIPAEPAPPTARTSPPPRSRPRTGTGRPAAPASGGSRRR